MILSIWQSDSLFHFKKSYETKLSQALIDYPLITAPTFNSRKDTHFAVLPTSWYHMDDITYSSFVSQLIWAFLLGQFKDVSQKLFVNILYVYMFCIKVAKSIYHPECVSSRSCTALLSKFTGHGFHHYTYSSNIVINIFTSTSLIITVKILVETSSIKQQKRAK